MTTLLKLSACCLLLVASAAQGATISLTPSQSVALGSPVIIDVVASGFGAGTGPAIGSYDLDVVFDPSLLSFTSYMVGSGLDVHGLGSLADVSGATPGIVNLFDLSLDSESDLLALQPDTFILFTLTFASLAEGTSALSIDLHSIAGAAGEALTIDALNGATVDVTAVPLPAAAWLLMSGVGLVAGAARRRRAAGPDAVALAQSA